MIPRFRILLLIAGLAVVAASCSTGSVAAVVDDTDIFYDDVTGIIAGEEGPTVEGGLFRNILTSYIVQRAVLVAAEEEFGITGVDTPEGRAAFVATASAADLAMIQSIDDNPQYTDLGTDFVTTQLAIESAVTDALLADPDLQREVFEQGGDALAEVCARHILTETEEEALDAKARVESGEDFSDVADEISLDVNSPGGQLQCPASPSMFVEPFGTIIAAQPVGNVSDPFQTQFGWHIVIVDSREAPESVDDIAADPDRWIPQEVAEAAWANWVNVILVDADVNVASPVGTWFPAGDGIVPPPSSPNLEP